MISLIIPPKDQISRVNKMLSTRVDCVFERFIFFALAIYGPARYVCDSDEFCLLFVCACVFVCVCCVERVCTTSERLAARANVFARAMCGGDAC
jgi:hypothetical protein